MCKPRRRWKRKRQCLTSRSPCRAASPGTAQHKIARHRQLTVAVGQKVTIRRVGSIVPFPILPQPTRPKDLVYTKNVRRRFTCNLLEDSTVGRTILPATETCSTVRTLVCTVNIPRTGTASSPVAKQRSSCQAGNTRGSARKGRRQRDAQVLDSPLSVERGLPFEGSKTATPKHSRPLAGTVSWVMLP